MEKLIELIKTITPIQWVSVIFAGILYFAYVNFDGRIKQLEDDLKIAREGRDKNLQLYIECINKK